MVTSSRGREPTRRKSAAPTCLCRREGRPCCAVNSAWHRLRKPSLGMPSVWPHSSECHKHHTWSCVSSSRRKRSAAASHRRPNSRPNSSASPPLVEREGSPTVAKAHARLARPCGANSASRGAASSAIASKRAGAGRPAVANAHAMVEMACGEKRRSRGAASAAIASKRSGCACCSVAYDHARVATPCPLKASSRRAASSASASRRDGDGSRTRANAQHRLASSCGLKRPSRLCAAAPSASRRRCVSARGWLAVAKDHAMLETACGDRSRAREAAMDARAE
mmetsp:Transcript_34971/g.115144  ORF Transcript_34971/g.115144 Transcript_34971/m.115144 type:complete len:281 (+) Transcript_34971:464-1306(+)